MFDHIDPGEFHDLPNPLFVFPLVALGLTFLAHGFGIMRALHPHGQTISEKLCAIRAQGNFFLFDFFNIKEPEGKRILFSVVMLAAIDPYKLHQYPDILFFFL
jgi:hypothetical protein